MTTTVTDMAGVVALQRASAAASLAARDAYQRLLDDPSLRTPETEAEVVALQRAAQAADEEMVAAWTWVGIQWAVPGDTVSDRGFLHARPVTCTYGNTAEVYQSSAAFVTRTWLTLYPVGLKPDERDGAVSVHLSRSQARQLAFDLLRFAGRPGDDADDEVQ